MYDQGFESVKNQRGTPLKIALYLFQGYIN
jgi:hypothetical protein